VPAAPLPPPAPGLKQRFSAQRKVDERYASTALLQRRVLQQALGMGCEARYFTDTSAHDKMRNLPRRLGGAGMAARAIIDLHARVRA
jgi:hypothetical protein